MRHCFGSIIIVASCQLFYYNCVFWRLGLHFYQLYDIGIHDLGFDRYFIDLLNVGRWSFLRIPGKYHFASYRSLKRFCVQYWREMFPLKLQSIKILNFPYLRATSSALPPVVKNSWNSKFWLALICLACVTLTIRWATCSTSEIVVHKKPN